MVIEDLGVVGWALVGILPAVLWTHLNMRRATRRRERQFIRRGAVLVWFVVGVYLAALRAMPEAYAGLAMLSYGVVFLPLVAVLEWRRSRLRENHFPGSYLFTRRAPFSR